MNAKLPLPNPAAPPEEPIVEGNRVRVLWQKFTLFIRRIKQHKWLVWLDPPIFIVLVLAIILFTIKQVQAPLATPQTQTETQTQSDSAPPTEQKQDGEQAQDPKAQEPKTSTPPPATSGGGGSSSGGGGSSGGACGSSATHVPDGPDGMGGCWPGPSNTGVPGGVSLSNYSGPCTITTAGTVIDAKTVNCQLLIRANNVVIKRSHLKGGVSGLEADGASFTIQDSFLDNGICQNCSVDGWNFTIERTEITGSNRGAYCMHVCTVRDSWIHGTGLDPNSEWHASAVRAEQYATLIHNVLACDYTGPFNNDEIGCSADMSGYPDFAPITHNTIDGNLFRSNNVGIGFCAYGGGTSGKPYSGSSNNATYIVFKNNVFERGANGKCGAYGAITDFKSGRTGNEWTNNKWSDGATVNPG
jgi:hypothetical protein